MVDIESKFKEKFPDQNIDIKIHRSIYVSELVFDNPEFNKFLDEIASEMSDEEYMNTDFMIEDTK